MQVQYNQQFSLNLHCLLVDYVLTQWHKEKLCPLQLWLAGDVYEFTHHLQSWSGLTPYSQQGNDLGERMLFAVKQSLVSSKAVILVGTDCPFIDPDYLKKACLALDNHDVVIGPADDGGYVLLGIKDIHENLFQGVSWGSNTVFSETIEKIKKLNLTYFQLPVLSDIDRPEDIALLKNIAEFDNLISAKDSMCIK